MPPFSGPESHHTVELSLEKNKALSKIYYDFLEKRNLIPSDTFPLILITPQERSWFFNQILHVLVNGEKITDKELDAFLNLYHVKVSSETSQTLRLASSARQVTEGNSSPIRKYHQQELAANAPHDDAPEIRIGDKPGMFFPVEGDSLN